MGLGPLGHKSKAWYKHIYWDFQVAQVLIQRISKGLKLIYAQLDQPHLCFSHHPCSPRDYKKVHVFLLYKLQNGSTEYIESPLCAYYCKFSTYICICLIYNTCGLVQLCINQNHHSYLCTTGPQAVRLEAGGIRRCGYSP